MIPVKQTTNIMPPMADSSRHSARYSRETPSSSLPATLAARISAGIVIAKDLMALHDHIVEAMIVAAIFCVGKSRMSAPRALT